MIVLEEVMVANGIAILMMWFLLVCRRRNRERNHTEDRAYDGMVIVNMFGALLETISFLIDGRVFAGARGISYILNSLCYAGTVTVGFLWCLYVDIRIYRNYKRTFRKVKLIMIPWLVEIVAIICNLSGNGILFRVSENNIYQRGNGAILGYITIMIYFAYSIYLVYSSKKQGINLSFFPVYYFVGPCIVGVLVQLCFYGVTTSWISVAVALTFVQMQTYAENLYMDELSGLYNRRYLNGVLAENKHMGRKHLYGIMMDINDFKDINDNFGHSVGDRAICKMGDILFKSIPDGGIAIRYAGDEFVVLLPNADEKCVSSTMNEINNNLLNFSESKAEVYTLSVSMGYTRFEAYDNAETFLTHMDEKMYEEKRKYHLKKQRLHLSE